MSDHSSNITPTENREASSAFRYIKWFLVCFLPLCLAVLVFKRTDLFPWVGQCDARGYDAEHYLAYCHTPRFGDYEHYAFMHDTEPRQLAALQSADVVFLGNSRTQFAFSTAAVVSYFSRWHQRFFLLGFGLGGKSQIPVALFRRYDINPKVLIVNADPFFSNEYNDTLDRVLENADTTNWEHRAKRFLQKYQASICQRSNSDGNLYRLFCSGKVETLYRSRDTGFWLTDYYHHNKAIPVSYNKSSAVSAQNSLDMLDEFLQLSGVRRECVIITITPRTDTPLAYADTLAELADLPAFFPQVDGLVTIDDSHLNKESAEKWSSSFLAMADETIQHCLAETSP